MKNRGSRVKKKNSYRMIAAANDITIADRISLVQAYGHAYICECVIYTYAGSCLDHPCEHIGEHTYSYRKPASPIGNTNGNKAKRCTGEKDSCSCIMCMCGWLYGARRRSEWIRSFVITICAGSKETLTHKGHLGP